MNEVLLKFDEMRAKVLEIIGDLRKAQDGLLAKEKELQEREKKVLAKEGDIVKREKEVERAKEILQTKDELDRLISEHQQQILSVEKTKRDLRQQYVKKQKELEEKENELNEREAELVRYAKKLEEEKKNYVKTIVERVTKNLGGE